MWRLIQWFIVAPFLLCAIEAFSAQEHALTVGDTEIPIEIHPAKGEWLAIWLPSEAGPQPVDAQFAMELAQSGIEVWRVDLLEAHFLPVVESSMDSIPPKDVQALVEHARQRTGKRVLFIATGRAAIPVLRGLHAWQLSGGDSRTLLGAVLFSPKLFVETPDPGAAGELMPVVAHTNLPLYIVQPDQSPWFWKLKLTVLALQQSGGDVYVRILRKARDRYSFRLDATEREKRLTDGTPQLIRQAAAMLDRLPPQSRRVQALKTHAPPVREGKKDRVLADYTGNPRPPALVLDDLSGKPVDLQAFRGTVVLINFWASWCPPCVQEMPSMQRLKDKLQDKPFVILAVNMAEDRSTVREFLTTKVRVDFPILFDVHGKTLQDWGVYAFPTSFVVDKNGLIRYALFGSIDWDQEDIVGKISSLF